MIFDSPQHRVLESPTPWERRWRELISGERRGLAAAAVRGLLWGLSVLYGGVMGVYRAAYDRGLVRTVAVGCRVISVGNLTVGGTGKSTTVRWIAQWLRNRGVPVAILSYGYRSESKEVVTVVSDGCRILVPEAVSGDEPRMLAEALPGVPVLIGKRRQLSAAEAVRRFGARVCVLDDAFQYWRLVKDLDVVLIDARCPFGGGRLLPRGMLREAPHQLRRADAVVITNGHWLADHERTALRKQLRRLNPRAALAEARHAPQPIRALEGYWRSEIRNQIGQGSPDPRHSVAHTHLEGRRVLALSSLGNPEGFEQTLAELGAEVVPARFPDHHHYTPGEVGQEAERARRAGCAAIVTTEKDAVKIDPGWAGAVPVWVLPVELVFESGEQELEARLDALAVKARRTPGNGA